jgi:hypothetical protein
MWWLLGPLVVFLLTAVVAGILLVRLLGLTGTDAVVPIDATPHRVQVPAEQDLMLWVDQDLPTPSCRVREWDGGEVALHRVSQRTTRDEGRGRESGRWQFSPGSGRLEVTCTAASAYGGVAAIGPAVTAQIMLVTFAPWFLLAMLLSAVWIGWLVALLIRLSTRTAPPPPAPTRTHLG